MDALIDELNQEHLKKDLPQFAIGDTVRVSTKIIEGDKERIQVFQGTVIARKGKGLAETFSLHRVSYGEGMGTGVQSPFTPYCEHRGDQAW